MMGDERGSRDGGGRKRVKGGKDKGGKGEGGKGEKGRRPARSESLFPLRLFPPSPLRLFAYGFVSISATSCTCARMSSVPISMGVWAAVPRATLSSAVRS